MKKLFSLNSIESSEGEFIAILFAFKLKELSSCEAAMLE